ncbi:Protein FAR1-RELATED SEQUENCE 5 [Dendrobium catenatum]|uniref:Protein FAR1-RELATED SEQUENCE 5 n=1 Tax=Dendrobium catenatum TaxID=906689 RepID=A0A2I0X9W0_9ASPA|nr:Protein FAR1-RELATED SEQUENCE 5 [Dendrobium catenatum]
MYCKYAHNAGFSVRKEHHSFWPNSRKIRSKDYVCSKAGFKKSSDLNLQRKYRKSDTRTGCPAMIRFIVDEDGNWKVQKFIESHNHDLARPEDCHLLRSCRYMSDEKASILKTLTEAGIRTVDAFSYLADEVGDAYNYIQKEKRAKNEFGDTNSLIQLFKERQADDPMFAWDVQFDELDKLLNFFWVDGMGRIDFDCFGDVVIFDTSYRLNKYNLVCAPFVGVNNHWQNILLGVAFLSEETIESFTWLFRTFVRIMGDKYPITIFTNQDQAMTRAIEVALPSTRHRLCQWHISKKAPSKVWCFNSNDKVRGLFYKCLSKCDSEEQFEKTWAEMITEGSLHSNGWLEELYKIRKKWSTAFNKDCFSMDILSTQRSEFINNVCHDILKPTSSRTDYFLGLEKVMMTWRLSEQDEDYKCNQSVAVPVIKCSPILKQAAQFYSRKLYLFFEKEFLDGVGGMSIEHASSDSSQFLIKSAENLDHSTSWVVHFDAIDGSIQCTCGKFETMGLLCSHCMRVFRQLDIVNIPKKYLLMRWSARAKKDIYAARMFIGTGKTSEAGSGLSFRNHIIRFSYLIAAQAQGNEDAEQYMLNAMKDMAENIDLILHGKKFNQKFVSNEKGKISKFKRSTCLKKFLMHD